MLLVEFLYNKLKFCKKKKVCYTNNYILVYLNIIKVNSKIKNSVGIKVTKEYWPSNIIKNFKKVKWAANKAILEDTKRANLDLKEIYNVSAL